MDTDTSVDPAFTLGMIDDGIGRSSQDDHELCTHDQGLVSPSALATRQCTIVPIVGI